jgi:predicted porin
MKKLLIAAAAMSVVAGAQAQSTVTLYGFLDANWAQTDTKTSSGSTKVSKASSGNYGGAGSSNVGIKGEEDLGGGLKAGFKFEADLNPSTGELGQANTTGAFDAASTSTALTTTVPKTVIFSRQANVYLSSAQFGTLTQGRTVDVVDSNSSTAGFIKLFDNESGEMDAGGVKQRNNITRYDTPVFSGVQLAASYTTDAQKNDNSTTNQGNTVSTYGITYTSGKFKGGYAEGVANLASYTSESKVTNLFGGYDFGVVNLQAQYTTNKNYTSSSAFEKTKSTRLGAAVPLSAYGLSGVTAIAFYQTSSVDNQDGAKANADYTIQGIAVQKALSKRTNIYAGYKSKNLDGTGTDVKTTVAGVTHAF